MTSKTYKKFKVSVSFPNFSKMVSMGNRLNYFLKCLSLNCCREILANFNSGIFDSIFM